MSDRVLVVGAGPAGLRCAEVLSSCGYRGRVTLVGDEPRAPYERPALSKAFLSGERGAEDLSLRTRAELAERGIEVLLGRRVASVTPGQAVLVGGEELAWRALVLATGARARTIPGLWGDGMLTLRTLDDAIALRRVLRPGARLAIVGAGFLGCEVATTALGLGVQVLLADPAPTPLHRALGGVVGAILGDRLRRAGADVRVGVTALRRDGRALHLSDGSAVDCDAVLVSVGAEPAGDLISPRRIGTDDCGRTVIPHVYACGDVADWDGHRHEHWTSATAQGAAVARTILGAPEPCCPTPFFWSDTAGLRLQLVGSCDAAVTVTIEGREDEFAARYLDAGGRTVSILLANRPQDVAAARHELAAAA